MTANWARQYNLPLRGKFGFHGKTILPARLAKHEENLVDVAGLEPAAPCLQSSYSTILVTIYTIRNSAIQYDAARHLKKGLITGPM